MELNVNVNSEKEFFTKDINEAAAILTNDIKLIRLERENNFYWFVFENTDTQEICNRFWAGELIVNAKKFSDALMTLKDRIFAQR